MTPAGAQKGMALQTIAQVLDIPLIQTVAFGDSDNDEAMLEVAGYAVQVGTLPMLTRHTHEVIPTQLELAEYLTRWVEEMVDGPALRLGSIL